MTRIRFIVLLIFVMLVTSAVDYVGTPVWVIRDTGSAFGVRHVTDTDSQWRVTADGVQLWGDGQSAPYASLRPWLQPDGRILFEFDSGSTNPRPVGIVLNSRDGTVMSLTAERGCLIVRNEYTGAIVDTIGECDQ
jgi:hypothetical protein